MRGRVARLLAGRLAQAALVAVAVTVATFVLLALAPGDATGADADPRIPPAAREAWRRQFGLDVPWPRRLAAFVAGASRGDLGWSAARGRPVREAIAAALGPTLLLSGTGLLLGLAAGTWLGTWQAGRAGSRADRWSTRLGVVVAAVPDFWVALLALTVVARALRLAPVGGWRSALPVAGVAATTRDVLVHLALPALTLATILAVRIARYQRTAVLEALSQPFTRAARARGLGPRRVLWRHAARTAAGTTIALTGLLLPGVVAGTVFLEQVFAWPGMGRLLLDAVGGRDVPLAAGIALVTTLAVVGANAAADLAQAALDPRVAAAEDASRA